MQRKYLIQRGVSTKKPVGIFCSPQVLSSIDTDFRSSVSISCPSYVRINIPFYRRMSRKVSVYKNMYAVRFLPRESRNDTEYIVHIRHLTSLIFSWFIGKTHHISCPTDKITSRKIKVKTQNSLHLINNLMSFRGVGECVVWVLGRR